MRQKTLGRTGLTVADLSFGCGNVGGLMVRGAKRDRVRAIGRAIELGITYFDTAAQYGDGQSERNLGEALRELSAHVIVGTKIRFDQAEIADAEKQARGKLEDGLRRLGRESVDILYLHNQLSMATSADRGALTADEVIGSVLPAFQSLRQAGLVRFLGFTGLGETAAVVRVIDSGGFDVMHTYVNAVNPSAVLPVGSGFSGQDLGQMTRHARAQRMGVLAIRVLAAGALAGVPPEGRGALAGPVGGALTAGGEYTRDLDRAERLRPLAAELGVEMAELAIRFVISLEEVHTALAGVADVEQFEIAARAAEAGPLPSDLVDRIVALVA